LCPAASVAPGEFRVNAGATTSGHCQAVDNPVRFTAVSTSWWWGAISPSWFNQYNPEGETWLIFPTLQLTPPWTNKYFTTLGWVEILGTDRYNLNGGLFKGKNMLTAGFQYNFSLM
jgi:hypothetical protein